MFSKQRLYFLSNINDYIPYIRITIYSRIMHGLAFTSFLRVLNTQHPIYSLLQIEIKTILIPKNLVNVFMGITLSVRIIS